MRKIFWVIGILLILFSCVKETSFTAQGPAPLKVCVDAIITDEPGSQTVILTSPVTQPDQPPSPVTGASVLLSNEDSTWNLLEQPLYSGKYKTPASFYARLQKHYTLLIGLNDRVYTAKATMIPGTTFPELKYVRNNDNNSYHIDWVANAFSTESAAMWELFIDWSKIPGYTQLDSAATHARMLFYTLSTLDVSEVFAPQMEKISFPSGTLITERRYSITPEHAAFIREILLETNWAGGVFNEAAANVTTNLSDGACGFFGVCAVTSLSVTVTP
ncbi:MAG: DUF4249 domain-containing protein [Bacteroidales bacterium]|jgi:hypothetical protein|nr:DUF4249 domain-containing protein [Bacteroidales bacterium]